MTVISVIKKDGVLVPADSNASGVLDRVKEGREILITARAPRSAKQHRFFWHLCRLISENSEKFDTPENVSDAIKIGTGFAWLFIAVGVVSTSFNFLLVGGFLLVALSAERRQLAWAASHSYAPPPRWTWRSSYRHPVP